MIFCHAGDNTELRVANPNLLPQSRRTHSATGLITCKFHRAFSIFKITNLLMSIIKLTYGYFCKFTSYSRFLYIKSASLSLDYRIYLLHPCNRLRLILAQRASITERMWFHISWRCPWHYLLQSQRSPVYAKPFGFSVQLALWLSSQNHCCLRGIHAEKQSLFTWFVKTFIQFSRCCPLEQLYYIKLFLICQAVY